MTQPEKLSHASELDSLWEGFKQTLDAEVEDCNKLGFYNRRGFLKTIVAGAVAIGAAGEVVFNTKNAFGATCPGCNASPACQNACHTGCQSCLGGCLAACQTSCNIYCQTGFNGPCTSNVPPCQQAVCGAACQVTCQACLACNACHTGCQHSCHTCQTGCQAGCQSVCQACLAGSWCRLLVHERRPEY